MKAWRIRTALLVGVACVFPAFSRTESQNTLKAKIASDSQLQSVLLQARDAVVAESHLQDGYDSEIETDVERVTRYLLQADNRTDVLYVQQHLEKEYAEKIPGALEPADTLADFAGRTLAAEQETDPTSTMKISS